MPILVALDEGFTNRIWMHRAHGMYLDMQAKGLSKQLVIWILEREATSSQTWVVGEMPLGNFFKDGSSWGALFGTKNGALIEVIL